MKRLSVIAAAAAIALAGFQAGTGNAQAQAAPTAPPPPPAPGATAMPLPPGPLPTAQGSTATITIPQKKAKATPAPPKDEPNRVGLSGVWEVALQQPSGVAYAHFKLTQSGSILTGTYMDDKNRRFPVSGSLDGKDVRLVVSLPNGSDLIFKGTEDANTDMVGTLDISSNVIGFTAAYRPKYKWTDNLNPSAMGGLPGTSGGTPY